MYRVSLLDRSRLRMGIGGAVCGQHAIEGNRLFQLATYRRICRGEGGCDCMPTSPPYSKPRRKRIRLHRTDRPTEDVQRMNKPDQPSSASIDFFSANSGPRRVGSIIPRADHGCKMPVVQTQLTSEYRSTGARDERREESRLPSPRTIPSASCGLACGGLKCGRDGLISYIGRAPNVTGVPQPRRRYC